jgi:hypothetical protein
MHDVDETFIKLVVGHLKGGYLPEDEGVDRRLVLKRILGKYGWRMLIGFIHSLDSYGLVSGSCEYGNKLLGSMTLGQFLG